jgi:hypothetical protein
MAPDDARELIAADIPADHASLVNFVALALTDADDEPVARVNEGAIVSAVDATPVTSVALPALIASDAALAACPKQGEGLSDGAMLIASAVTHRILPTCKERPPKHRARLTTMRAVHQRSPFVE